MQHLNQLYIGTLVHQKVRTSRDEPIVGKCSMLGAMQTGTMVSSLRAFMAVDVGEMLTVSAVGKESFRGQHGQRG